MNEDGQNLKKAVYISQTHQGDFKAFYQKANPLLVKKLEEYNKVVKYTNKEGKKKMDAWNERKASARQRAFSNSSSSSKSSSRKLNPESDNVPRWKVVRDWHDESLFGMSKRMVKKIEFYRDADGDEIYGTIRYDNGRYYYSGWYYSNETDCIKSLYFYKKGAGIRQKGLK